MTLETETRGGISLKPYGDLIESVAARSIASASGMFAEFLKNRRFDELFENRTGETKNSIGSYRYKGKKPAYVVKAGAGIKGGLNYLLGLYRGYRGVSGSGKVMYTKKRDLITGGWKDWGGEGRLEAVSEEMLERMIKQAEARREA